MGPFVCRLGIEIFQERRVSLKIDWIDQNNFESEFNSEAKFQIRRHGDWWIG